MLVNLHTKRVNIPHEAGEWMELRRLTFGEMKQLSEESLQGYFEALEELPQKVLEARLKLDRDEQRKREAAAKKKGVDAASSPPAATDPLAGRNLEMILQFGIMAWSYVDAEGAPVPVGPLTVAALDEVTADWAARAIMLFDSAEKKDDDSPLGSSSTSTDTSTA